MMRFLGALWWWVLPVRRATAVAQLHAALPDADPGPVLRHAVGSAAFGYLELMAGRWAEWRGLDQVTGGGLCLAGHGGAWDLAMVSFARQVPLTVFVKAPSNPVARWVLRRLRTLGGTDLQLLPPAGSMADAHEALNKGRLVVFVVDQRHNRGVPVPCFGRPAWTSAGFAVMAWKTRAPLYGTWQRRDPDGRVRGDLERLDWPIPEDRDEAIATLTAQTQQWVESKVRRWPADWWWLHKRWKRPTQE